MSRSKEPCFSSSRRTEAEENARRGPRAKFPWLSASCQGVAPQTGRDTAPGAPCALKTFQKLPAAGLRRKARAPPHRQRNRYSQASTEARAPAPQQLEQATPKVAMSSPRGGTATMSQVMLDEKTRLRNSTVARIVAARGSLDDPETKKECCRRLQKINNMLKDRIAEMDATMARDAMHAGILKGGFSGCDNSKLIAVLCTRTKASLNRTKQQYRAKFDRDLCKDVKSKTGSDYGRMMGHALSDPDEYVADVIHAACHGMGCDENALIELCMTRSPEQLEAGKKCWEGRRDKALFDYIGKELGMMFKDLKHLILEILKGKRNWTGPVDKKRAAHHAERLHHECTKNMFQNFHEVHRGVFHAIFMNRVQE